MDGSGNKGKGGMSEDVCLDLAAPHPDLELGVPRQPLRYAVTRPDSGIDDDTGLILYIGGYGSAYDDAYTRNLRSHLANTYNCVTASVDYFGAECHQENERIPAPDFFVNLKRHFGLEITASSQTPIRDIARAALDALCDKGVTRLPPDVHFISPGRQYDSFGLLPALDCLQVTHRLIRDYPVNRGRMFLLGSSYGGYIGLLINKIAPATFRLIIDNSGFSSPADTPNSIQGVTGLNYRGLRVAVRSQLHFSLNPEAPNYFNPAFAKIRELRVPEHYSPSDTSIQSYHSATDDFAPIAHKRELFALLAQTRPAELMVVGDHDLDGRCFKTLEHGMQASMRGLFQRSYERWLPQAATASRSTDFDHGVTTSFRCHDLTYTFALGPADGIRMSLAQA